jgi:hypothetical protein
MALRVPEARRGKFMRKVSALCMWLPGTNRVTLFFGDKLYPLFILLGCIILSAQIGRADVMITSGGANGSLTANLANYLYDSYEGGGPDGYYNYLTPSYKYFNYDLQLSVPAGDVLTDATIQVGAIATSGVSENTTSQTCIGGDCPYINSYSPGLTGTFYELEDPVTHAYVDIGAPGTYDLMAIFGAGLANGDPIEVLGEVYLTDGFNYEYFDNCFFGCTASNTVDSTEQGNYTASGGLTLTYEPIPTPEPGSVLLFGTVLLGLYWAVRRKSISKT